MHAPDSERYIAARCVTHPDDMAEVIAAGLRPEAFAEANLYAVVQVAFDLFARGELSSHHVVHAELKEQKAAGKEGFEEWWSGLISEGWSDGDLTYHVTRVKTAHELRRQASVLAEATRILGNGQTLADKREATRRALRDLLAIQAEDAQTVMRPDDMAGEVKRMLESDTPLNVYEPTGLWSFDSDFSGLPTGRVSVVAARTNHGKSAFADQVALNVARRFAKGKPVKQVLKFDLENGRTENLIRLTSNLSGVAAERIKHHLQHKERLAYEDLDSAKDAADTIRSLPYVIDAQAGVDSSYIRARVLSESARMPVGLVVVDYAEIMGDEGDGPNQRIMNALRGLHVLASETGAPVVVVSQINRAATQRSGGVPHLSDLSWSDALAKYSSMVIMLHHEWMHWEQNGREGPEPLKRELGVFVRKNKGPTGAIDTTIDVNTLRITDEKEPAYRPF